MNISTAYNTHKKPLLLTVLVVVCVSVLFQFTTVFAGLTESARGFAWGGTSSSNGAYRGMGWISMNNLSDGSGVSYGVNIPSTNGNLSGYAWSEHYGWISFNGSHLSGCSPALSQARRNGNSIVGGARILSIRNAGTNHGGFDGCISLSGGGYGISISGTISPYSLSGYAWSSDLGWIDFSGVQIEFEPSGTITATECEIPIGSNSCNIALTWEIRDTNRPNVNNQTTNTQYSTNPTGTNVSASVSYGTQTIAARDNTTVLDSEEITISCAGIGEWRNGSCIDPRPNLTQPLVDYTPSTGFDAVTGMYNSMTVTFQTENNGGGSTGIAPQYRIELDEGRNGYEESETGSLGVVNVGQWANRSESFANVMFGNNRVRVTVDSANQIDEINESDNVQTLNFELPPPDPQLSIEADRTLVRQGDTVTLTWSAAAGYPMNCSVRGPAGVNVTDNAAPYDGTTNAGPITAKSEFIFRCTEPITNTVFTETEIVEVTGTPEEV